MKYAEVTAFAQSWGLLVLLALFAAALVYAFWPGNRRKFERASRAPLEEDDNAGA